ncbi:MAG: phosphoribosyltransferase [Sulfolobales archaeon]|nr:phosphoribosyltransferase [Sulfolobales archaeon]MCX8185920.1 phosphoribosyltransferase [Sulfolobales archaeon]MDW7969177.1 phosphoribosyltransferase [Sulfolobales archaeon]
MSYELAMKVSESNYLPDVIVAVSRGGLIPARIVSDVMNVDGVHSIKASLWGVGGRISNEVLIHGVELPIKDKKVLIVDDVVDSGLTLIKIVSHVKSFGPIDVRTAVLHVKPSSKYLPDYYVSKLDEWLWVIYPWTSLEVLYSVLHKHYGCKVKDFDVDALINEFYKLTGVGLTQNQRDLLAVAKKHYLSALCRG